jgi:hypothetical protein
MRAMISIAAFAGCIVAEPAQAQAEQRLAEASSIIAENVLIDGKTYVRLPERQLRTMVVGRQIMATVQHAAHQVVMFFGKDGTYESSVGRDPLESGTYVISNGAVLVRVPGGESIERRLYQAADDELMMATRNGTDEVHWTKVRVRPL